MDNFFIYMGVKSFFHKSFIMKQSIKKENEWVIFNIEIT